MESLKMDQCHCNDRKAHHSKEVKKDLSDRLSRIEGQVRGVRRLIEEDTYCDGILNQITSIESALNGVRMQLLENHIRTCVVEQYQEGRVEVIDELMATINRMVR